LFFSVKKGLTERNLQSDSMRKKFKTAVLEFFIKQFNLKATELNLFKNKKERLRKLNKKINSTITIPFNKQMIERSMMDLYQYDDYYDERPSDINRYDHNQKILLKMKQELWVPLRLMMEKTMREIIINFINSHSFLEHLHFQILNQFNEEYLSLYLTYAYDYVDYFSESKANIIIVKKKFQKKRKKRNLSV
jgi:hypothetical protein